MKDETLILLVESNELLYNMCHRDYSDNTKKERTWKEIGKELKQPVHEVTPNTKLLTGCGDGVRNESPKRAVMRTPVPSCRRFSTRPPPSQGSDHHSVKVRLQTAIQELASHPNITRRRALTMAEINPTRSLAKRMDGLQLSSPAARGAGGAKALESTAPPREEDAGRRVYQVLLLNAWRRRRAQVATLTDSLRALETQNGKLELQIDALRRLRQAECEKRSEAVTENQRLQVQVEESLRENQNLTDEKAALEKEVKLSEHQEKSLQLDLQNARNDWMTARCEVRSMEHQFAVERAKIKKLRDDKVILLDRLSHKEQDFVNLTDQIENLQERLLSTELNLQDTILSNSNYEDNMKALVDRINAEAVTNAELQRALQELTVSKEKLEGKLQDFRKSTSSYRESARKLEEENQKLKMDLTELKEDLKREQERPWWKNAGELALAPLNALQNAAYIMLPAIPSTITRTTSTTDMPTRS